MSDKLRELVKLRLCEEVNFNHDGYDCMVHAVDSAFDMYKESKHETVEQWESRTGETYPDDGPVWLIIDSELWATGWNLMTKEYWLLYNNDEQAIVYVANHHGKPE